MVTIILVGPFNISTLPFKIGIIDLTAAIGFAFIFSRFKSKISERILKKVNWNSKIVPRPIQALSAFITVSSLLENQVSAKYFEKAAYELLGRYGNAKKGTNEILEDLVVKEELVL